MKKSIKLISTLLMVVMLVSVFSTICFAKEAGAKDIIKTVGTSGTAADTSGIQTTAGSILKTLRNVAAIIAVVVIAILGIKYMLGSVEERAEYKKSFVPLIIGVVVVFAAVQIATMIVDISTTSTTTALTTTITSKLG